MATEFSAASLANVLSGPIGSANSELQKLGITGQSPANIQPSQTISTFLNNYKIDGTRWNKIFPYSIRMVLPQTQSSDATSLVDNRSIEDDLRNHDLLDSDGGPQNSNPVKEIFTGLLSKISQGRQDGKFARVILPIAPSNITISTPGASNLSVTLNGITEEHNGAPLRMVKITGSTGVSSGRLNVTRPESIASQSNSIIGNLANSLFANTIKSVDNLLETVNAPEGVSRLIDATLADSSTGNSIASKTDDFMLRNTGYYKFLQLVKFFDAYLQLKKNKNNKDIYLIFEMRKDEMFYKCSFKNFTYQKKQGTLEYEYTIDLVAWDYSNEEISGISNYTRNINYLQSVVNTMRRARNVIAATKGVFQGFQQDVGAVLGVLREGIFVAKDAIGLAKSVADLPQNIANQWQSIVLNNWESMKSDWNTLQNRGNGLGGTVQLQRTSRTFEQRSDKDTLLAGSTSIQSVDGSQTLKDIGLDIKVVFNNTDEYPEFFDRIDIERFAVPISLQEQIEREVARIATLDVNYFIKKRNEIEDMATRFSASLGANTDTWNRIKGFDYQNTESSGLKDYQMTLLKLYQDAISSLNSLIVQLRSNDRALQSYIDFYINIATANGIDLRSPNSKFAVPMPLGGSLQSLSAQYLGDAARWPEIAALNGLRSPYIDEEGFEKTIKGSTTGKILSLSDSDDIYINQPVIVLDNIQPPVSARIKKIENLSETNTLVTLDKDVTGYGESTGARLKAYLPGTVNSNSMIYIPSQSVSSLLRPDFKLAPDINDQQILSLIAQVDILLTSSGDLATTSSGDVRYAMGTANLLQAAKLKCVTPLGSLVSYPWYGFGVLAGANTTDFNVQKLKSVAAGAFAADPRFSKVLGLQLSKVGGVAQMSILLGLPNIDTPLPLNINYRQ